MKKFAILILSILIAGLFVACNQDITVDAQTYANMEVDTFVLNGQNYATLQEAVNAKLGKGVKSSKAAGGNDGIIYLMKNTSGPGAVIDQHIDGGVIIDFNNYTYSFTNVTGLQGGDNPKAETFGLGITNGADVTLRGLQKIDLNDKTTTDLTMVYVEGATTSLTIEDAPKMEVANSQYVFWAANGATLTIGSTSETAATPTTITGKIAATGEDNKKPVVSFNDNTKIEATELKAETAVIIVNTSESSTVSSVVLDNAVVVVAGEGSVTVNKNDSDANASYEIQNTSSNPETKIIVGPEGEEQKTIVPGQAEEIEEGQPVLDPKIYVAAIGAKMFEKLEGETGAISVSQNGDTIVVLKDIEVTVQLLINKKISLDLNGKELKGNYNGQFVEIAAGGELIINDSSYSEGAKLYNTNTTKQGNDAIHVAEGGSLIINGGSYGSRDSQRGASVRNDGKAVINDGSFTSIDNNKISGAYAYALINNGSNAEMIINNATVSGKMNGCVAANAGRLIINDITAELDSEAVNSYYAVWVTNDGLSTYTEINGGTFTGYLYGLRAGVDDAHQDTSDARIVIKDGTFKALKADSESIIVTNSSSIREWGMTLYGGEYYSDPSAYVADGYVARKTGDVWTVGKADTEEVEADGTKMSLVDFAKSVNAGHNYANKTVKLLKDVDLAGIEWTPIGNNENPFSGVFDGQDFTVSNITVNMNSNDAGLFGVVRGVYSDSFERDYQSLWDSNNYALIAGADSEDNFKTIIKDLKINRVNVSTTEEYAGALAGYTVDTYISNIHVVEGKVYGKGGKVGGVVGAANGWAVLNDLSTDSKSTVKADRHTVAGIVGSVSRKYADTDHTPIIRDKKSHAVIVENCVNNASVVWDKNGGQSGLQPIAGIIGNASSCDDGIKVIVCDCKNSGTITANSGCSLACGIVGQSGAAIMYKCDNSGDITADAYDSGNSVAGVAGITCAGEGPVIACINSGTLVNNHADGKVYDISGSWKSIKIEDQTYSDVSALKAAIDAAYNETCTSVVLKNVTVTDNTGVLVLPNTIQSISSNTKVCDRVDLSGNLSRVEMIGLTQAVPNGITRSITFGGTGNTISVENSAEIGNIGLTGDSNSFTNNGTMRVLSYSGSGTLVAVNNGTMKGLSSVAATADMTFTNNGTVSRTDWHTIHLETGGKLTLHNKGTITGAGNNPYALLFYSSCNVDFYAYSNSVVTGGCAYYSTTHQVNINYADGTTIDSHPWTTLENETYHVHVSQMNN